MPNSTTISFANVSVDGDFWRKRLEILQNQTIPSQYRQMQLAGTLDALAIEEPPAEPLAAAPPFAPEMLRDAEIAKWLEAASYSLAYRHQAAIEAEINAVIEKLGQLQLPDGYLNSWFIANDPTKRWTNLRDNHELYSAGHLIEAAVAHFQATGEPTLVDIMLRYVDLIAKTFGTGENQRLGYCGHQEIELALARLYGVTKDQKHLDLATYFIDQRGQPGNPFDIEAMAREEEFVGRTYEFNQSHRPVRHQDKAIGHTERAITMYAAMACIAREQGDGSLRRAAETLWADVTQRHLYVTGGLGPDRDSGTFGEPYDLPNEKTDTTTSAAVALVLWAKRMLALDLDGKYADVMELALYNGALAGISFDGRHYFHHNPLTSDGTRRRWEWNTDASAATDIARLIAAVGGLFYSTSDDGLAIHLYGGASATLSVGGRAVGVREVSNYPWSGSIRILLEPTAPEEFTLRLRIPAFAQDPVARINNARIDVTGNMRNGYLEIRRKWNPGDTVALDLPMPVDRLRAHPSVKADAGRVALRRGPLIYCLEQADNGKTPLDRVQLPKEASLNVAERSDLLGGIVTITAEGSTSGVDDWGSQLYRSVKPERQPAILTAIPYFLWGNREPGAMVVWLPED